MISLTDAAFSMTARISAGPWSQWKTEAEDEANTKWHSELIADLAPFNSGYYIGESNTVEKPSNTPSAFLPENWKRLANLRDNMIQTAFSSVISMALSVVSRRKPPATILISLAG